MKRVLRLVCALLCVALVGCSFNTTKSYSYDISETKESIKVTLDTTDGYDIEDEEGVFIVTKDGKTVITGSFLTEEMREEYRDAVTTNTDQATVIEDTDKLFSWTVDDEDDYEYNEIVTVKGAKTYVLMNTTEKPEKAEKLFQLMSFELDTDED